MGGVRTLRNGQSRAPLVPQDVETDAAVGVDVGVVDAGGEVDLRGLEWVVGRKVDVEEEDASRVWRVTLRRISIVITFPLSVALTYRTHDGCLPVELLYRKGKLSVIHDPCHPTDLHWGRLQPRHTIRLPPRGEPRRGGQKSEPSRRAFRELHVAYQIFSDGACGAGGGGIPVEQGESVSRFLKAR